MFYYTSTHLNKVQQFHEILKTEIKEDKMIDLTTKQPQGGQKKSKGQACRKHDAINLPKNLIDSDSEDEYEEKSSSEDDNDQYHEDSYFNASEHKVNKLSREFLNMKVQKGERDELKQDILRRFIANVKKYKEGVYQIQCRHLKARSPYRNKLDEHKKNKVYGDEFKDDVTKHDLTVTTSLGSGGRVAVQAFSVPGKEVGQAFNGPSEDTVALEALLLETLNDSNFLNFFSNLSSDEVSQILTSCSEQDFGPTRSLYPPQASMTRVHRTVSPDMAQTRLLSPITSPGNLDFNDSSYETGSPCSTVVTSPGGFSPPRTSISSESDQEIDCSVENSSVPITNMMAVPRPNVRVPAVRRIVVRTEPQAMRPIAEPVMRPLGEPVNLVQTSATDRLLELQNSTSFCTQHFSIQLVRVFMSAKAHSDTDKIEGFAKSLMSTMKIKLGKQAHEGDIWQLSILAHIQFLLARAGEYREALVRQDEQGHNLLYLAAIQHHKTPLIARYIAESMIRVNYNPLKPDAKGKTIIHELAELGDSHVHVLGELLVALGSDAIQAMNQAGQTALHVAVQTSNPHISTTVILLQRGANPLQQDGYKMTPLHYHMQRVAMRVPRLMVDVELIKKMIHSPIALTQQSLQTLEMIQADCSFPADLTQLVVDEISRYCIKDVRMRKNERRVMQ